MSTNKLNEKLQHPFRKFSSIDTNCLTSLVLKNVITKCYFTTSTASSAESWICKGSDFLKRRNQHAYILIQKCTGTKTLCSSTQKTPCLSLEEKKTLVELLLTKVQTILYVTFCVHICSADMQKTHNTRTLFCKHQKLYRIQAAHLFVC